MDVSQLLVSWGLSEEIVQLFEEEEIDEFALRHLDKESIQTIFKGKPLGLRIKFESNLRELLQNLQHQEEFHHENSQKVLLDANIPTLIDDSALLGQNYKVLSGELNEEHFKSSSNPENQASELTIKNNNIDTNLNKNISETEKVYEDEGQILKKLLGTTGTGKLLVVKEKLDKCERGKISNIIIEHLLSSSQNISRDTFMFWAAQICSVFKFESSSTYYIPAKAPVSKTARGRLYDTYTKLKKFINRQTVPDEEAVNRSEQNHNAENADILHKLNKLRTITPDSPCVLQLWNETFQTRDRGSSIDDYFNSYPVLKTNLGVELIKSDFEQTLNGKHKSIATTWPDIAKRIILFATENKICEELINDSKDITHENLAFFVLPYLFKTVNIVTKKNSSSKVSKKSKVKNKEKALTWRPSKAEIAKGFILKITTLQELEEAIESRKNNLLKFGLTLQPQIIFIGSLHNHSIYVYINGHKYLMLNLIGAVEFCFMAFYALNAQYPADCKIIWHFLERYVFEVNCESDISDNLPSSSSVWSDLQGVNITEVISESAESDESGSETEE